MADYIKREAVLKHLRECEGAPPEIGYTYPIFKAIECFVEEMPASDVMEVVHGRWIAVPSSDMMTGKAYKCSECNKIRYGSFMPNYCAICGAKMGGERKEKDA